MLDPFLHGVETLLVPRLPERGVVLDLACGDGTALTLLRRLRPAIRLLGYERDGALLKQARSRGLSDVTLARFDLTLDRPPPAAGRVDGVLACGVMDVLSDVGSLLSHLRRLLRAGAPLLVHESTAARMSTWKGQLIAAGFTLEEHGDVLLATSVQNAGAIKGWD